MNGISINPSSDKPDLFPYRINPLTKPLKPSSKFKATCVSISIYISLASHPQESLPKMTTTNINTNAKTFLLSANHNLLHTVPKPGTCTECTNSRVPPDNHQSQKSRPQILGEEETKSHPPASLDLASATKEALVCN
jgi:hypothetical protein